MKTGTTRSKVYAAYGSNMNIQQMRMRCPNASILGMGKLHNYRLTFRGISRGVANIERKPGRVVPVVLWEITPECEQALDVYEGFPRLYVKREVSVETVWGRVKAMVYVMARQYEHSPANPSKYYLEIILQGYLDHGISLRALKKAVAENASELSDGEESAFWKRKQ